MGWQRKKICGQFWIPLRTISEQRLNCKTTSATEHKIIKFKKKFWQQKQNKNCTNSIKMALNCQNWPFLVDCIPKWTKKIENRLI